jgi:ABC-type branched-subunit amino acid transport system permease subunit
LLREFKDAQMVIYGVLLVVCVQFLPGGLISLIDRARSLLMRKPDVAP